MCVPEMPEDDNNIGAESSSTQVQASSYPESAEKKK